MLQTQTQRQQADALYARCCGGYERKACISNARCSGAVGWLSRTPRIKLDLPSGGTSDRFVTVRRAPEPSDFVWSNIRFGGKPVIKRRVILGFIYFGLLVRLHLIQINNII
jgi:hypothetical protein